MFIAASKTRGEWNEIIDLLRSHIRRIPTSVGISKEQAEETKNAYKKVTNDICLLVLAHKSTHDSIVLYLTADDIAALLSVGVFF